MTEKIIHAVHDRDLENLLRSLNLLDNLRLGKILKTVSEHGQMPVSMIVEEMVKGYGNPKVAKAAVSRALRQLEAQGLVKVRTSSDRRIKIYSLA